ncbi:hypothetical protein BACSTE_01045 [Bacteroides stercoris ATCC 43183]|uniref:Uncharacterized protein n=1 Tax=Bacteroides stercoris ATCC 43183 TaxID=449673 RepID=B0NNS8_BACSE|nr:hypothetical protein BACSTE_01045 [Bacteroides stercoris ATCC 43183]
MFLNFLFPNLPNDIKHIFQVNIYGIILTICQNNPLYLYISS